MSSVVRLDRSGATAIITLDRPEARNALSLVLLEELSDVIDHVATDDEVRAVVLTGTDPAFCAGVDLKELESGDRGLGEGSDAVGALIAIDKPVIGAINGPAVTGGLELALACDFRIGSERARFADTHARVGVVPGWGLTVRLPREVGLAFAKQMSMTGNYVDADTALRTGLVNELVDHEQLLPTAKALADDIASTEVATQRRVLAIYEEIAAQTDGPALAIEDRAHRRFNAELDHTAVAERRRAVTERGRAQQDGPSRAAP